MFQRGTSLLSKKQFHHCAVGLNYGSSAMCVLLFKLPAKRKEKLLLCFDSERKRKACDCGVRQVFDLKSEGITVRTQEKTFKFDFCVSAVWRVCCLLLLILHLRFFFVCLCTPPRLL